MGPFKRNRGFSPDNVTSDTTNAHSFEQTFENLPYRKEIKSTESSSLNLYKFVLSANKLTLITKKLMTLSRSQHHVNYYQKLIKKMK